MVVLSSSKRLASWLYPYLDANLLTLLAVMARQQVVVSKWKIKDLSDRLVGQTFKKNLKADSHNYLGVHDPGSRNCAMFVRYICTQYQ